MNTKNLPQQIHLLALANPAHLLNGLQALQLLILTILALISFQQPGRIVDIHPSQQPAPYQTLVSDETYKKRKELTLASVQADAATSKQESAPVYATSNLSKGFALIKQCESGGNYRAINPAGYYGAYQFNPGTWNSTASAAGRSDLVGVRPDKASPADQDAMAKKLHSLRGWQPWGCAYHVGLL